MSVIRSHEEDMERIRAEHENAMEAAREVTRRETEVYRLRNKGNRPQIFITFLITLGVVCAVLGIVAAVRADGVEKNRNKVVFEQSEAKREAFCIQAGGAWIPKEIVVGDQGVCVFTGQEK